jgi:hypothetical protein
MKETTPTPTLPKRKQKVDVCFAKTLSPSQKKHAKQNSCHSFYTQNWILFYFYAICNLP